MWEATFQAICKLCYYVKLKKNESAIVEPGKTIFNKITHDKYLKKFPLLSRLPINSKLAILMY